MTTMILFTLHCLLSLKGFPMRSALSIVAMIAVVLIAASCSSSGASIEQEATNDSTEQSTVTPSVQSSESQFASYPTPKISQHRETSGDRIVAESLDELVASSKVIVVTTRAEPINVVNMARNRDNPEEPDEYIFVLGQVYDVEVEQYLKGDGASVLQVVQREGFVHGRDEPVAQTYSRDEVEAIKQSSLENSEHLPLGNERRYVMFLRDLGGFDPELGYLTGAAGIPWRFEMAEDGTLAPESESGEANEGIGPLTLSEVEAVIDEVPQ